MEPTIGFIGVGRMGIAVCGRLVAAGYEVVAHDRRPAREEQVCAIGATWAAEASAAAGADVLVTMLPGTPELDAVMDAVLPTLRPGTTWIDMTSSTPDTARKHGARARAAEVACLDAPVAGDPEAAHEGRLQVFVGGEAGLVERHRRLFEALGAIEHVGGHGSGYACKLLVNLLWFGQAVATAEALLLGRRAGLDLEVLRMTLGRSPAATEFVRRDLDALFDGDYLESFALERCCEELRAALDLAGEHAVPFELSTCVSEAYERALERYGHVDGELLAVKLLEERAGTVLRRDQ